MMTPPGLLHPPSPRELSAYRCYVKKAGGFDATRLELSGEPRSVGHRISPSSMMATPEFSLAGSVVAYQAFEATAAKLIWLNRNGTQLGELNARPGASTCTHRLHRPARG
jgi:hypothetical protein